MLNQKKVTPHHTVAVFSHDKPEGCLLDVSLLYMGKTYRSHHSCKDGDKMSGNLHFSGNDIKEFTHNGYF